MGKLSVRTFTTDASVHGPPRPPSLSALLGEDGAEVAAREETGGGPGRVDELCVP